MALPPLPETRDPVPPGSTLTQEGLDALAQPEATLARSVNSQKRPGYAYLA
jgi:hypothetical protein